MFELLDLDLLDLFRRQGDKVNLDQNLDRAEDDDDVEDHLYPI